MTRAAWFCPCCQKHHAPHIDTCPAPAALPIPGALPVQPFYPKPGSAGDVPYRLHDIVVGINGTATTCGECPHPGVPC